MKRRHTFRNRILGALPAAEFNGVRADLASVELQAGQPLYQAGKSVDWIYFPEQSVISFLGNAGEGGSVEVWSVGNEGMAGISGILSDATAFSAVVQVSGTAQVIRRRALLRHFAQGAVLHDAVLRYYDRLLIQASQLGVCNNMHAVEQRFSRWLLMLQDRSGASNLNLTQESIAGALGTRRATISVAAAALQEANVISYTPGSITINSRRGLQAATCPCYKVIKAQFDAA
jgi:CRP-like cAMP-binding protein